jgi:hypothetical protein
MEFTEKELRLAALIHWADNAQTPTLRRMITNEIWCISAGFDAADLVDLTVSDVPTSTIVKLVQDFPGRTREVNSHLLVCTIPIASEIMAREGDENLTTLSEELNDCIGVGK